MHNQPGWIAPHYPAWFQLQDIAGRGRWKHTQHRRHPPTSPDLFQWLAWSPFRWYYRELQFLPWKLQPINATPLKFEVVTAHLPFSVSLCHLQMIMGRGMDEGMMEKRIDEQHPSVKLRSCWPQVCDLLQKLTQTLVEHLRLQEPVPIEQTIGK